MDLRAELVKLLQNVGQENIWRPVHDNENVLLAGGHEDMRDGCPRDLSIVNFQEKTVLDIGCNFGFYSFLAKRLGAKKVVGIDIDERAITGCNLLKALYGLDDMHFYAGDLTELNFSDVFDISIMINFIGKEFVIEGIHGTLNVVEQLSQSAMIISAQPNYGIVKHLGGNTKNIIRLYPTRYIKNHRFFLVDFLRDYFRDNWDMSIISPDYDDPVKRTLLFTRKKVSL